MLSKIWIVQRQIADGIRVNYYLSKKVQPQMDNSYEIAVGLIVNIMDLLKLAEKP